MPAVRLPDGSLLEVPAGLGPRGTEQWLLARGVNPEMLPPAAPAAGDGTVLPSEGALSDLLTGAGLAILRRTPGLRDSVRGMAPPDSLAADVGGALPAALVGAALPGAGWAGLASQAALGGAYEAMDPDATAASIMGQTALGGAGAAAGDLLGRVASGATRAVRAFRDAGILGQADEGLRALANAGGGNAVVDLVNRRGLTAAAAASFGAQATRLTPAVLEDAAATIGQRFDDLLPEGQVFDLSDVQQALEGVQQGGLGVRAGRVIQSVSDWTQVPGPQVRAIRSALAERGRALLGDAPALADDLLAITDDIDQAAERVLGADFRAAFRQAREQWKNLRLVESLASVRSSELVSPADLSRALAREGRGYGTSFVRDTGTVLPETQRMFDAARQLTVGSAFRAGNPGTAEALTRMGAVSAAAGALTGAVSPAAALAAAGAAATTQAAGLAAVGAASPVAGRVGAQAGRTLAEAGNESTRRKKGPPRE